MINNTYFFDIIYKILYKINFIYLLVKIRDVSLNIEVSFISYVRVQMSLYNYYKVLSSSSFLFLLLFFLLLLLPTLRLQPRHKLESRFKRCMLIRDLVCAAVAWHYKDFQFYAAQRRINIYRGRRSAPCYEPYLGRWRFC